MRSALRWVRGHWAIVAGAAALLAVGVTAAVVVASNRPPTGYGAGSPTEPGILGETFRHVDDKGAPWRWGALTGVAESLPLADGYTEGRCYVSAGWIDTTRAGYAELSPAERGLTVAYYLDDTLMPTGDATAACDIEDVRVEAAERGYLTLDQVLDHDTPLPQFYTVTYALDDVEPDFVVLTPTASDSLNGNPSDASVYAFAEYSDMNDEGASRVLELFGSFPGRPGR